MQHPFQVLRPEYERRLASLKVTRRSEVNRVAEKLCSDDVLEHYLPVAAATNVPVIFQAATFERESSTDFRCSPAQGDPWKLISTHVPRGRGPYKSWIQCAIDSYERERVGVLAPGVTRWDAAYFCWKVEAFNGFGPRNHGRPSGYIYAGTDQYDPPTGPGGKYASDGVWVPGMVDKQLGALPVALAMIRLRPELALPGFADAGGSNPTEIPVTPVPVGVGGEVDGWTTEHIQEALNKLRVEGTPIMVDGNYGRRTRAAVRSFQKLHHLASDGIAGPLTVEQLKIAVAIDPRG
jgi:lysozyme family protein